VRTCFLQIFACLSHCDEFFGEVPPLLYPFWPFLASRDFTLLYALTQLLVNMIFHRRIQILDSISRSTTFQLDLNDGSQCLHIALTSHCADSGDKPFRNDEFFVKAPSRLNSTGNK
jgi:hypothetical protein